MQWASVRPLSLLRSPTTGGVITYSLLLLPFIFSLLYRLYAKVRRRKNRGVGLSILRDVSDPHDAEYELVAIHGLGANPEHTWISHDKSGIKSVHLLKDLIANDDRFSKARILHFAYNSDWLVDACFESAHDIGRRLLASLEIHRENRPRLPIIFVGHSFGGIVIKEALCNSLDDSSKILEDTCGIIFLGTPHLGSPVAGFGATIAYLTGYLGSDTGLLLSLRSNHERLIKLSIDFQACVKRKYDNLSKTTRIISICERKPTYFLNWLYAGMIVPLQSATFGTNFVDVYEVDKDHSGLNKCANTKDPLYMELTKQLHSILPNESPRMNLGQQDVINLLRPFAAVNAEFHPLLEDRYDRNGLQCLPNTREEILREICDWLGKRDPTDKRIYWLQGKAGTGKSTIARTVTSRMIKKDYIVANFFFKRGEGDRARLQRFFTTLAIQLVGKMPNFAANVRSALESNYAKLDELPFHTQFRKLIQEPIQKLTSRTANSIVIIIDALDECDSPGDISTLVQLLAQPIIPEEDTELSATNIQVKYLLTSRLDNDMEFDFNNLCDERWERRQLEEITSNSIKQDIRLYLKFQLENIKGVLSPLPQDSGDLWSNPQDVKNLDRFVELASPLFVFATTACRFIADSRIPGQPKDRLHDILEYGSCENLDSVYLSILERRFRGLDKKYLELATTRLREVVVSMELQHFQSVLAVPPETDNHMPVKIFHESFRDFLMGPEASEKYKFDPKGTHQYLLSRCHEILCGKEGEKSALREDICNLTMPGTHRREVSEETVHKALPPELQYASRFWIHHLKRSGCTIKDDDCWHSFLLSHFLHWLEALSFLGRASESLILVKELQTLVHPCDSTELKAFLNDAERFILSFRPIINAAPLQLYSSALTFAPTDSIIRKTFNASRSSWITRTPIIEPQWSPCLQTLEGHTAEVHFVVFSPNGNIASGDVDGTIKVWDPISGLCLQSLDTGGGMISSLAFSQAGKLACGTTNSISVWETDQGICLHKIEANLNIASIAFLDNQRLSFMSDQGIVSIWKLGNDHQQHFVLPEHDKAVLSLDGQWLAWEVPSGIKMLEIKDRTNMTEPKEIKNNSFHRYRAVRMAFSQDNQYFASVGRHRTIRVCDVKSTRRLQMLKAYHNVLAMAFSPNSLILATASDTGEIITWDWKNGTRLQTLTDHGTAITSLAFSSDGAWLASSSRDHTVKVWDTTIPFSAQIETHPASVTSVTIAMNGKRFLTVAHPAADPGDKCKVRDNFGGDMLLRLVGISQMNKATISPNGEMIAAMPASILQLWDLKTSRPSSTIHHFSCQIATAAFSANSEWLVIGSEDGTVYTWRCGTEETFLKIEDWPLKKWWGDEFPIAISSNGDHIAAESNDLVLLKRLSTGEQHRIAQSQCERLSFSTDGLRLAAISDAWVGSIWNVTNGACLSRFELEHPRPTWQLDPSFIDFNMDATTDSPAKHPVEDCLISHRPSWDGEWIMRRRDKLLWLPPEYRASSAAAQGNHIAIGCVSGRAFVIGIGDE